MEAGQMVCIWLKYSAFISTQIIGILTNRADGKISLRQCCVVNTVANQQREGISIVPTYITNPIMSEGTWEFSEDDLIGSRVVGDSEVCLKAYDEAWDKFRANRAGLHAPGPRA